MLAYKNKFRDFFVRQNYFQANCSITVCGDSVVINFRVHYILKMLMQYDLPTKKTPNNIHECSA